MVTSVLANRGHMARARQPRGRPHTAQLFQ